MKPMSILVVVNTILIAILCVLTLRSSDYVQSIRISQLEKKVNTLETDNRQMAQIMSMLGTENVSLWSVFNAQTNVLEVILNTMNPDPNAPENPVKPEVKEDVIL